MRVVQIVSHRRRLRLLAAMALAAAAAIAWRAAHRTPAPPPAPPIVCAIPDVTLQPQFATPPPGDPYPRPDLDRLARVVEAVLVERPSVLAGCGTFLVETTMVFHPLESTGAGDLRVLVPCAEMTRAEYGGSAAGNAGVLVSGHRYLLWLREAIDAPNGKNDTLWRADQIDER
jgi:hypothetical protein